MKIEIKKGEELSKKELDFLINQTNKIFYSNKKRKEVEDKLKKEKNSYFFLLKEDNKILSYCFLKPTKIIYKKKNYNIFGIRHTISVKSKRGYGTILMKKVIKFLEKKEKTGLGFTGSNVAKFYKKVGFKTKAKLRQRFFPDYSKEKVAHWGFYIEGDDKIINRLLKNKSIIKMPYKEW